MLNAVVLVAMLVAVIGFGLLPFNSVGHFH